MRHDGQCHNCVFIKLDETQKHRFMDCKHFESNTGKFVAILARKHFERLLVYVQTTNSQHVNNHKFHKGAGLLVAALIFFFFYLSFFSF